MASENVELLVRYAGHLTAGPARARRQLRAPDLHPVPRRVARNTRRDGAALDRAAPALLASPRGCADGDPEPPAADVPAAGTHVDAGELLTAQTHEVVAVDDRGECDDVRRCCGQARTTNAVSAGVSASTATSHGPVLVLGEQAAGTERSSRPGGRDCCPWRDVSHGRFCHCDGRSRATPAVEVIAVSAPVMPRPGSCPRKPLLGLRRKPGRLALAAFRMPLRAYRHDAG